MLALLSEVYSWQTAPDSPLARESEGPQRQPIMAPIDKIYAIKKRFSKNRENYPPRDPVEVVWRNRAGTFSYRCRSQLFEDDMSMGIDNNSSSL